MLLLIYQWQWLLIYLMAVSLHFSSHLNIIGSVKEAITLSGQQHVSQSSRAMVLGHTDYPHNVSVTRPRDPASHHNHHVA